MNLLLTCEITHGFDYLVDDNHFVTVEKTIEVEGSFSDVLKGFGLIKLENLLVTWFKKGLIEVGTVLVFDRQGNSTVLPEGKTEIEVYEDGDDYVINQNISREVGFGDDNDDIDVWEEKTVKIPK